MNFIIESSCQAKRCPCSSTTLLDTQFWTFATKVVEEALVLHELCDNVDGLFSGADGIELDQPWVLKTTSLLASLAATRNCCYK